MQTQMQIPVAVWTFPVAEAAVEEALDQPPRFPGRLKRNVPFRPRHCLLLLLRPRPRPRPRPGPAAPVELVPLSCFPCT